MQYVPLAVPWERRAPGPTPPTSSALRHATPLRRCCASRQLHGGGDARRRAEAQSGAPPLAAPRAVTCLATHHVSPQPCLLSANPPGSHLTHPRRSVPSSSDIPRRTPLLSGISSAWATSCLLASSTDTGPTGTTSPATSASGADRLPAAAAREPRHSGRRCPAMRPPASWLRARTRCRGVSLLRWWYALRRLPAMFQGLLDGTVNVVTDQFRAAERVRRMSRPQQKRALLLPRPTFTSFSTGCCSHISVCGRRSSALPAPGRISACPQACKLYEIHGQTLQFLPHGASLPAAAVHLQKCAPSCAAMARRAVRCP